MVFLRDELVLENELVREVSNKLRQLASLEFAIIFHKHKHRLDSIRYFGDEIEYIIVNLNHKLKLPQLLPIYPHIQSIIQSHVTVSPVTVLGQAESTSTEVTNANSTNSTEDSTKDTGTIGPSTVTEGKGANSTATECTMGKGANSTAMECTPGKGANSMGMECTGEKTSNEIAVVTNFGESSTFSEESMSKDIKGTMDTEEDPYGVDTDAVAPSTVTEELDWKKCIFTPEYGSYMVESIPDEPYKLSSNYIKEIRKSIKVRRRRLDMILRKLGFPNAKITTLTNFIRIGCKDCVFLGDEQFRQPLTGELEYKLSNFFPNICITPFSRFTEITHNIKLKNNSNILIPKFNTTITLPNTTNILSHTTNGKYH
uniref:Glutamate--cysteine ligase n=1 Tax=Theileria annulata TaxID=5874 RepID=A0A3B0N410_THEAN